MKAPSSPTDALIRIAAYGDAYHDRELAFAALSPADRRGVRKLREALQGLLQRPGSLPDLA